MLTAAVMICIHRTMKPIDQQAYSKLLGRIGTPCAQAVIAGHVLCSGVDLLVDDLPLTWLASWPASAIDDCTAPQSCLMQLPIGPNSLTVKAEQPVLSASELNRENVMWVHEQRRARSTTCIGRPGAS